MIACAPKFPLPLPLSTPATQAIYFLAPATQATLMREVKYYLQLLLRHVLSLLDYSQWVYLDKSSSKLRRQIESQSQQESPLASMSANQ